MILPRIPSNNLGESLLKILFRPLSPKLPSCLNEQLGLLGLRHLPLFRLLRARSFGLSSHWRPSSTSRSIGQPLAGNAPQRRVGAHGIVDPEGDPIVVPEIELGEVAMQVPL